jgi:hypothetical protein
VIRGFINTRPNRNVPVRVPDVVSDYLTYRELTGESTRKWIEKPRRVVNEHSRTYETGLSWLTISANQASRIDR